MTTVTHTLLTVYHILIHRYGCMLGLHTHQLNHNTGTGYLHTCFERYHLTEGALSVVISLIDVD